MNRRNKITRTMDGKVVVIINSVQHTLTVPAFLELMGEALKVVQNIEYSRGTNGS